MSHRMVLCLRGEESQCNQRRAALGCYCSYVESIACAVKGTLRSAALAQLPCHAGPLRGMLALVASGSQRCTSMQAPECRLDFLQRSQASAAATTRVCWPCCRTRRSSTRRTSAR